MRIVIDIDGDQVRVHRVIGDALPPSDVIEKATALNAESAGVAMLPGGVAALGAVGAEPSDAGHAPSSPRGAGGAAKSMAARRGSRGRSVSKSRTSRRTRR